MLLFYFYNHQDGKNISLKIQKKNNCYYTFIIEINKIDSELESIIFLYFYYDMHNREQNVLNQKENIYKWNNLYLDIKEKKIYPTIDTNIQKKYINQNN